MDAKKPFHEVVAEGLIEQLKQGTAPWIKPWKAGDGGGFMPFNPTTGKRYKGINAIHLMAQGRSDQRWLTYKQAAAVGGQVRKGEKSTPIQYWKFEEEQTKRDENNKPVLDGNGNPVKVRVRLERPKMFMANVFNAEQIDGLPEYQRPVQTWNALERAEQIFTASGAEVRHGGDSAYYSPSLDRIQMPSREQFGTADDYYRVKLHELGHWTGHPSRLDRDLSHPFGSEMYAKEELRAEIASMILGEELGLGHDPGQHVSYVQSWIKVLQNDPLEIFRAASDAEKIQGFVLGLEQEQIQTVAESQSITSQAQDEPVEQGAKMELPSAVKQPNKQAEDWSLAAVKRADLDQVTVRMTAAQLDTFEQTLNSMLPLDDSNEFWKSRPAAMDAFYADTSLFLPDEQIMSALDVVRDEQARRSRLEAPGEPVEIPTVTPASEMDEDDRHLAFLLYDARTEGLPHQNAALKRETESAFEYPLSAAWNGGLAIEGRISDLNATEGHRPAGEGEQPEFFGIYASLPNGQREYVGDFGTDGEALQGVRRLESIQRYALSLADPHELTAKDLTVVDALRAKRAEIDPVKNEALQAGFQSLATSALGYTLPGDWTGRVAVVGQVSDRNTLSGSRRAKPGEEPDAYEVQAESANAQMVVVTSLPGRYLGDPEARAIAHGEAKRLSAIHDAAGQELSQARDLPELSQNHKMVATALRNVRSEPDPALKASFGNLLAVTSAEALGYELPSNWSGKVEVDGIARDSDGEGVHKVDADEVAEFYGLYVRDSEGLAVWLADYETLEQAQEQAESLLAVHDYVAAVMGADAPPAEQEFVERWQEFPPDEMTPEEMAESQAEERTYIQVPFKEKGQARELGGKWDGDKKSWYVPAGVDPQPFAKWLTGGDEVPTAGIPAAAQAKTQEQSVSPAKPSQTPAGDQADGRTYIQVPFKEKGQARELGGKWDRVQQSWYVPAGVDPQPFSKWFVGASAASQEASKEAKPDPANIPAAAPTQDPTREYLAVPFGEREAARAAGAAWDKVAKSWYVGPNGDPAALARWKIEEVRNSQEPAQRLEDEFADALRACGLVPGSYREKGVLVKHPVLDGQKHRIPVVGGRSGSRDGFYVAYTDGHPAGFIQNNKTGVSMNWKSKGYTLSDEEKAVLAAEAAVKTQAREAAQLKTHQEVAERVNASLATMIQAVMPTPYLQAKSIMPLPGVLTDQTFKQTVIPAMDTTGKVWTAQYIQKDGTKRFAKDGRKEGCFHPLGGLEAIAAAPALVIGEGYATARSLATVLGFGTVAAFDSGNLDAVVKALHEKFPDKPVIVAGDDDAHLVLTHGVNVGRAKAQEAAKAVGGKAIFPTFAPGEVVYPSELPPITPQAYRAHAAAKSDYEDMISQEGAEAEKSQRAADLKAVMLSDAQVAALSKMKRLTDFNDLQTKSSLGEDGLVRQVKNAVAKVIEDHQAQQQTQQRKQTQALAADDAQPRRSISR